MRADVRVFGAGEVVLQGQAVFDTLAAFQIVAALHRGNGAASSPRARSMIEPLLLAASLTKAAAAQAWRSEVGTTEPITGPGVPVFAMTDPVSVREAATALRCSESYVRRLCRRSHSQRFETAQRPDGRTWLIERAEVQERTHR